MEAFVSNGGLLFLIYLTFNGLTLLMYYSDTGELEPRVLFGKILYIDGKSAILSV